MYELKFRYRSIQLSDHFVCLLFSVDMSSLTFPSGDARRSAEMTGGSAPGDAEYEADRHVKRTGARAFLRAAGFQDDDFAKKIITVGVPWRSLALSLPVGSYAPLF